MPTVREYMKGELDECEKRAAELTEMLNGLPDEVGLLEADAVASYGGWLVLTDSSHMDLGSKLATITNQTLRYKIRGTTRTAVFKNVGPFYKVDLDRPNPKCRKVRVLKPAEELKMEICGDIPDGYELLEELDVPA